MASTAEILSRVATRPTWAEVSLATLRQNFRTVQKHVGANVTVCAVVKADAYGHGAVECSHALEAEGARWLGVTSLDEAIPLREAGIAAAKKAKSCVCGLRLLFGSRGKWNRWRMPPPCRGSLGILCT